MSQTNEREKVTSPVLFNPDKVEEMVDSFIVQYYNCFFDMGSPAVLVLIPEKLKKIQTSFWRNRCILPSKWELKTLIDESQRDLIFITPQKETYVVPVVLPITEPELCLGFILGNFSKKIKDK